MTKKPGLSWIDHRALGLELTALHQRLCELTVTLDQTVGRKAADKAQRVAGAVGRLRAELDRTLFRDYPERDTQALASVYYGGATDEVGALVESNWARRLLESHKDHEAAAPDIGKESE